MAHQDGCIFCKIARGEIPVKKHFEDKWVYAIEDLKPAAPTHLLFIPKEHIESLVHNEDPQIMGRIFSAISQVAKEKGISTKGFRTVINTGEEGGQTVFHLHVHIMAGKKMSHAMT